MSIFKKCLNFWPGMYIQNHENVENPVSSIFAEFIILSIKFWYLTGQF